MHLLWWNWRWWRVLTMTNGWLQLWLLSLIRSSFPMSCRKKKLGNVLNTFILYHQHHSYKPSSGDLMWFCSKLVLCQIYFFIKSCLSHTFPRAVQSVTQTERVHLSLPIYGLLFSPRLSPSCNAGMVDSCLLIQCHGLFPLFVLMSAFSGISGWVRVPLFQGPLLTPGHTNHKVIGLFPACLTNLSWPSQ